MNSLFGGFSDLVSSVSTVVKEISQEIVDDVQRSSSSVVPPPAAAAAAEAAVITPEQTHKQQYKSRKRRSNTKQYYSYNDSVPCPSNLELKYVTDSLLVMPQPTVDARTVQQYFFETQQQQQVGVPLPSSPPPPPSSAAAAPHGIQKNDVTVLADYLQQTSETTTTNYRVINLTDTKTQNDSIVQWILRGRVVQVPWKSPASPRCETPNLGTMIDLMYIIHAAATFPYDNDNDSNSKNRVILYCANGKTRSALVVACYLVYTGICRTVEDGFVYFLQRTQDDLIALAQSSTKNDDENDDDENENKNKTTKTSEQIARDIWYACPPSLHTFGRNFTRTIDAGLYHQTKPLLLRAVALQGIPVEDKPSIDIWDGRQRHIYSSNNQQLWNDVIVDNNNTTTTTTTMSFSPKTTNAWDYGLEIWDLSSQKEDEEKEENDTTTIPIPIPIALVPPIESLDKPVQISNDLLQAAKNHELPSDQRHDFSSPCKQLSNIQQPQPQPQQSSSSTPSNQSTKQPQHESASPPIQPQASQWADEEGFYRVNVVVEGDFCMLVRFGGTNAKVDNNDPSTILFRYANTTVHMGAGGPYELPLSRVDVMRRYRDSFDADDFLCTLLLEAYWNVPEPYYQARLAEDCTGSVLPPVYTRNDIRAVQRGWNLMANYTTLQPTSDQVEQLYQHVACKQQWTGVEAVAAGGGGTSPRVARYLTKLCLQEYNLNMETTKIALESNDNLFVRCLRQILQETPNVLLIQPAVPDDTNDDNDGDDDDTSIDEDVQNILNIIDSIDFSDDEIEIDPITPFQFGNDGSPPRVVSPSPPTSDDGDGPQPCFALPDEAFGLSLRHMPRQGEILNAFGDYYQDIHGQQQQRLNDVPLVDTSKPLVMGESFPQVPLQFPSLNLSEHRRIYSPLDDPANAAAVELLLKMNHPGVSLRDLTNLLEESRTWNLPQEVPTKEEKEEETTVTTAVSASVEGKVSSSAPPIKDHPEFSKYFKMLKDGKSNEDVKEELKKDGNDLRIVDLDPEQSLSSQLPSMADQEALIFTKQNVVADAQKSLQDALNKKAGPKAEVIIPKKGDTKIEAEVNQNPQAMLMAALNKNKASTEVDKSDEGISLRADPEYEKYFKMLKIGMPKAQIQHAMTRDEKDPTILDLDPERSLIAQRPPPNAGGGNSDGPPLKDDAEYAKYFKMLKMGMAKEQVSHALQRDGKDISILDMDPNKSLASQQCKQDCSPQDGPPLNQDPELAKYFKMLKMGLPKDAVKNALLRDGKDPSIMDMDPNKSLKSQNGGGGEPKDEPKDDGPPLKQDPDFTKYFKMLCMGLPKDAVKNALLRDGKDPSIMDLDPEKSLKSQTSGPEVEEKNAGIPLKEDPEFSKYFKMLSMGLPKDAVKNALLRDGKDPSIMDLDPEKSLKSQTGGPGVEEKDTGVPLKEDPEFSKYFKMLSMGLPKDAVKNALIRDGKDPAIMDLDPAKSVEFQMKNKSGGGHRVPVKKKKKVRRKKIYWTPIQPEQIKEDSIWNLMRGSVRMDSLNYDVKEFEDLFTESADPADRNQKKKTKTDSKQKKSVQVIDGKRSMNGGIVLARMKVEYSVIAKAVDEMQHRKFDATQLKALKEFLPDPEEKQGLKMYMKKGETDATVKEQLYKDLSECEKYMYTLADIPKAAEKIDCMLFRNQFKRSFEEILESISTVEQACKETRSSERLRKMMATILTLVNQINTGGEGNEAAGFSLDALLKLNEAKAFDKKTSVLMYLAKLVKKNDESLLGFQDDLKTVRHAENIVLDSIAADIKNIEGTLENVHATAAEEAARLEAAGELRPFSLADLRELKTTVYTIDDVPHFNKVDHQSGRTPMERFALNSQDALKQARSKIKKLKGVYANLLEYFGEDEQMPSNEFFGTMMRFIEEFQEAHDEVEKMEQDRMKEEKRAAKRAEQEKRKSLKRDTGKTKNVNSEKPSPAALANLASLAAAKSSTLGKKKERQVDAGVGGIAAMAAMAAAKKIPSSSAPPASGLAALAAQAASKKSALPPSLGGVAAMAAMAAAKKDIPTGGIAGLAAAAAAKKSEATATAPPTGGIAGLAAAAAAKKSSVALTAPQAGGIAGLAAAAAAKRSSVSSANPSTGGLAALAYKSTGVEGGLAGLAATTVKKSATAASTTPLAADDIVEQSAKSAFNRKPEVGLANLAAMKAQKKTGIESPSIGGISGLAAAAASKKEPESGPDRLAAMAAAKKEIDDDASSSGPDWKTEIKSSPSGSDVRKRKVYDDNSGLYSNHKPTDFAVLPDTTFSPGRALPSRSKSSIDRVPHHHQKSRDSSIFYRPISRSKSDTSESDWLAKSSSFPLPSNIPGPEISRSQPVDQGSKDDFMALLGRGHNEGDEKDGSNKGDSPLNFTMRRLQSKKGDSQADS